MIKLFLELCQDQKLLTSLEFMQRRNIVHSSLSYLSKFLFTSTILIFGSFSLVLVLTPSPYMCNFHKCIIWPVILKHVRPHGGQSNLCIGSLHMERPGEQLGSTPQFLVQLLLLCFFPILLSFKFLRVGNSKAWELKELGRKKKSSTGLSRTEPQTYSPTKALEDVHTVRRRHGTGIIN